MSISATGRVRRARQELHDATQGEASPAAKVATDKEACRWEYCYTTGGIVWSGELLKPPDGQYWALQSFHVLTDIEGSGWVVLWIRPIVERKGELA